MHRVVVTSNEFNEWASAKEIEYAACSIPSPGRHSSGVRLRLVFAAIVSGGFVVRCGSKELYRGNDFSTAAKAFNDLSE